MDVPYSEAQTYKYLHRIHFPLSEPPSYPPATLETLRRLVACHLHAIPFEDLSLHYSANPKVTVTKDLVFDKFVNQRRGGYCMEQNRAFSDLLQTLGYDVYTVGARVHMGNENGFGGFAHMAIIITLDGIEYLTDVGFGGNGLTAPIPIFDGEDIIETPIDGVMPEQHRVTRGVLPHARKRGHQGWLLQSRRNIECEWEMIYAFEKDFEFFPRDYEVMNWATSTMPDSLFVNAIMCTVVNYNESLQAVSRTILSNGVLTKRENGESQEIIKFKTEEERVKTLKEVYGITFTQEEQDAIKGSKLAVENLDTNMKSYF